MPETLGFDALVDTAVASFEAMCAAEFDLTLAKERHRKVIEKLAAANPPSKYKMVYKERTDALIQKYVEALRERLEGL